MLNLNVLFQDKTEKKLWNNLETADNWKIFKQYQTNHWHGSLNTFFNQFKIKSLKDQSFKHLIFLTFDLSAFQSFDHSIIRFFDQSNSRRVLFQLGSSSCFKAAWCSSLALIATWRGSEWNWYHWNEIKNKLSTK